MVSSLPRRIWLPCSNSPSWSRFPKRLTQNPLLESRQHFHFHRIVQIRGDLCELFTLLLSPLEAVQCCNVIISSYVPRCFRQALPLNFKIFAVYSLAETKMTCCIHQINFSHWSGSGGTDSLTCSLPHTHQVHGNRERGLRFHFPVVEM
jgi:hypothetical protein